MGVLRYSGKMSSAADMATSLFMSLGSTSDYPRACHPCQQAGQESKSNTTVACINIWQKIQRYFRIPFGCVTSEAVNRGLGHAVNGKGVSMQTGNKVKDIMTGIFDYPHIPYWFSISQAIRIVRVSFISTRKYPDPVVILVFDEKYNLMGSLSVKEILKGLEPGLVRPGGIAETDEMPGPPQPNWEMLFSEEAAIRSERPVSEIMTPVSKFVEPGDSIKKAAYVLLYNELFLLPVLEDRKKLVGLVRMIDIFDALSKEMVKE